MQINQSTVNPYKEAQDLTTQVEGENGNGQIDSSEELGAAKEKLANFKIPGTSEKTSDQGVLVSLNNRTGDAAAAQSWQASGARTELGRPLNMGPSNQSRLIGMGALPAQINSEHNSFMEFSDGSIGFKSTMEEGKPQYGIFRPDEKGNINMAKDKAATPSAEQQRLLDQAHSLRQKRIANVGDYDTYRSIETVQDQIADLKAATVSRDGKVSPLLGKEQQEYLSKLESQLSDAQSGKTKTDTEALGESLHDFEHFIIDNPSVNSYIEKTMVDDANKGLGLNQDVESGSSSYLLRQADKKSSEKVAQSKKLVESSESPSIPIDADYQKEAEYQGKDKNFMRPYYEAFGKDEVKGLEEGGKLTAFVNVGGTNFTDLSLYKVGGEFYYDYDDEGVAGKAGEDTQEYQMLKEDTNSPDKYTGALPVTRLYQDDLKHNIMVHEAKDTVRVFQLNQEISANKDGSYTLTDSDGKQTKFNYAKGLLKKII